MKKVLSVGSSPKAAVVLSLLREDGVRATYFFSQKDYIALGSPVKGDYLSGEREVLLETLHERRQALAAALRILDFGDNNEKMLTDKLRRRGFSADAAERAVRSMREHGYIREGEQAARAVLHLAGKLYGPRRIRAELTAKGFSREDVEAGIAAATSSGDVDFTANRAALLKKKQPPDANRAAALLYRYGYGQDDQT